MDFLKALFESGALTWEQFSKAVEDAGYKIADLSTGNYVSKRKYDDDISTRDTSIADLNTQITTRDKDIKNLMKQLEDGDKDNETKVSELTEQLGTLKKNYETAKQDFETRLSKQAYDFAVKDFASTKKFSSNAAKRDFIKEMTSANLTMKDNTILGAEDFATKYATENEDAFLKEAEPPAPEPPKPSFGQPTPPQPTPDDNAFISAFNFSGIRAKDK